MILWSDALGSGSVEALTSNCCLIEPAMAGTKFMGFKSKSSHRISPNCSGVINCSTANKIQFRVIMGLSMTINHPTSLTALPS